jgi:hypothetical protein
MVTTDVSRRALIKAGGAIGASVLPGSLDVHIASQASTSFAQMTADQQDAYLQGLGWNAYGRRRQRAVPAFHSAGISAGIAAGFSEAAGEPLRRMTQLCSRSK